MNKNKLAKFLSAHNCYSSANDLTLVNRNELFLVLEKEEKSNGLETMKILYKNKILTVETSGCGDFCTQFLEND